MKLHRTGFVALLLAGLAVSVCPAQDSKTPAELQTPNYRLTELTGIGYEPDVQRQDPSNVIQVQDTYYVWYTRRKAGVHPYASTVYYATSTDGVRWTERGEALGKGAPEAWDSFGVITPYVVRIGGKYYIYYTGTHAPHGFRSRDPDGTLRHIGIAVADSPDGPFKRFEHNPVLSPSKQGWDSLLVDDAHIIKRHGKYWFYFKGGHGTVAPSKTQWGVAIGDAPTGPFVKHEANPLTRGHTVCVWPHRGGVAGLADLTNQVLWSPDGLNFSDAARVKVGIPVGCGPMDADAWSGDGYGDGVAWGVAQFRTRNKHLHLVRFDCELQAPPKPGR